MVPVLLEGRVRCEVDYSKDMSSTGLLKHHMYIFSHVFQLPQYMLSTELDCPSYLVEV
jgi:hypothetical protein